MSEEKQPKAAETPVSNPENFEKETDNIAQEAMQTELPTDKELENAPDIEEVVAQENEVKETATTDTKEEVKEPAEIEPSKAEVVTDDNATEAPVTKEEPAVIPVQDYTELSKEELISTFKELLANHPAQNLKDQAEGIKNAFNAIFEAEELEAKTAFLEEGGNIIDFRHYAPLKKDFNEVYYDFRNRRQKYYNNKKKNQQENLDIRTQIIEELKALKDELGGSESVNITYNKFKDLQERWHNAGNIPRDRYNLIWNNYYHHVDQFYDFLHLNRDFRDKHYEQNLIKKVQLIERAEELAQESDVNKAFKELQLLHRMWKEEIGPVAKEYSDVIWEQFSAATKTINDKRQEHIAKIEEGYVKNLEEKHEIISKIAAIVNGDLSSHGNLQKGIKEVEALRERFFKAGKVPQANNQDTWDAFKGIVREFNKKKNAYYKNQKSEQYDNLNKKKDLIKIANEHKDSDDFEVTIELMKKIQADWKKIGHVPRKDSDKVWHEFKAACNHFFDRLHASKNKASEAEEEAYEKKKEMLDKVSALKLEGEPSESLALIKSHIADWKALGRVPRNKRKIDEQFNKALDGLFSQLDISRKESEMIKYENKLASMAGDDSRDLNKEHFFITKKIEETQAEINQLENNLGFFQHVADDNPLVKEVHKNIAKHKESLELWKAKKRKIKSVL